MNEDEVFKKLESIDHKINFLADAYKHIHNAIIRGVQVNFQRDLFHPHLDRLNKQVSDFDSIIGSLKQLIQKDTLMGTLAFMAKRLNEIEESLRVIKEEGVRKKFHLDLTMNGQELMKKKPKSEIPQTSAEEHLANMLMNLPERNRTVLILRYGLMGESGKTYKEIGERFKVSVERIRQLEKKSLRMLRHPKSKKFVMKITHLELKRAILGIEDDQYKNEEGFEE